MIATTRRIPLISFLPQTLTFLAAEFSVSSSFQHLFIKPVPRQRIRQGLGDPLRKAEALCISNHKEMTADSPKYSRDIKGDRVELLYQEKTGTLMESLRAQSTAVNCRLQNHS